MRIAFIFCFILMVVSCKQDAKINLPELKEGYYEFEILEKYVYPPDSTDYLKYAIYAQIDSKPGFLIKKSTKEKYFSACVSNLDFSSYPDCNPWNCSLEIIQFNFDSICFQKPPCYLRGGRSDLPSNPNYGPKYFVDSTIKYQPKIIGLKLNDNSELVGYWNELVRCQYSLTVWPYTIDSIVDRPIFAKFKLKFVKGI